MNKTEMAEWLAENVLEALRYKSDTMNVWCIGHRNVKLPKLSAFIYSPDGFFAVWDAVIKNKFMYFGWRSEGPPYHSDRCTISKLAPSPESTAYGDRYEAFYNAVYEAMEK